MTAGAMTLPREWSRGPQWASEADRAAWEPVLLRAQQAWSEIELVSITEGVRNSALLFVDAAELPGACSDCARVGLELSVLASDGANFRVAVHRRGLARDWHRAWADQDDDEIGALLSFPVCCREFFRREWAARGSFDVVPAMAEVDGPWASNILLRWMGVRLVPHLPCSGICGPTRDLAQANLEAGRRARADVVALEALLRLPISYSSLNGLALIETPHFRFMTSADPAPAEVKRWRVGSDTESPWRDNGFSSLQAMEAAHAVIVQAVGEDRPASVLDLGCGDGTLLARMRRQGDPDGRWVGVEADEGRAARGMERHGRNGVTIYHGRLEDPELEQQTERPFDVVLLMPGRLLELPAEDAARVRAALPRVARRLVLYTYGDHGALAALAERAGLALVGPVVEGPGGVQAAEGAAPTRGHVVLHGTEAVFPGERA
jgi:methyltransferase family protein